MTDQNRNQDNRGQQSSDRNRTQQSPGQRDNSGQHHAGGQPQHMPDTGRDQQNRGTQNRGNQDRSNK